MASITFIHGIANKPPEEALLEEWLSSLASNDGIDLELEDVSVAMVYWADVMYDKAKGEDGAEESFEDFSVIAEDDDLSWIEGLNEQEMEMIASLRNTLGFDAPPPEGENETYVATGELIDGSFEAIPLPWFIKRRVMKAFLRDVHHYLYNAKYSPNPATKPEVYVQDVIREDFVSTLKGNIAASGEGPHLVVSHSMGTVISYDCLKHVDDCPEIDAYLTLGSPLGISEVHDNFPDYDPSNAFPAKVKGSWTNFYDRLDPVCGLDPVFANDYQENGVEVITDIAVKNEGRWRHSLWKYFARSEVRETLKSILGL